MAGGRIRTLKPELLEDERVADLGDRAFRLFVGAILLSDDHGNLRGAVGYLRGQIYWGRVGASPDDVEGAMRELQDAELVRPYRVRGQAYLHLRSWHKHQKIDKPGKPKVPTPEEADPEEALVLAESTPDPDRDQDLEEDQDLDPDRACARAREARPFSNPRENSRMALERSAPRQLTIADRVDPPPPALPPAEPADEPEPPPGAPLTLAAFLAALATCSSGRFQISHRAKPRERRNGAAELLTLGLPQLLYDQLRAELLREAPDLDLVRQAGALLAARDERGRFVLWGQWVIVTADNLKGRLHELLTAAAALAPAPAAEAPPVTAEPNTPEYYAQIRASSEAKYGRR